jgi:hypothetical protein
MIQTQAAPPQTHTLTNLSLTHIRTSRRVVETNSFCGSGFIQSLLWALYIFVALVLVIYRPGKDLTIKQIETSSSPVHAIN